MHVFRFSVIFVLLMAALCGASADKPAQPKRGPFGVQADAIQCLRQNNVAGASAALEAQVAKGMSRDARDQAITAEWLGVAMYFYNVDQPSLAKVALAQATDGAAALQNKKGAAAELYPLYRNLGSLTEIIRHDRPTALAYYNLALTAARSNPQIAPSDLDELVGKAAKTAQDDATAKEKKTK